MGGGLVDGAYLIREFWKQTYEILLKIVLTAVSV